MLSNSFLTVQIVLLLLQYVASQIIFNSNFTNVKEQEITNFLPQNYVLQENATIYITLTLFDQNNFAILEVCTQQNCIKDQNSIDFKHNIQYIRIENDYDNQEDYNGLSYAEEDYKILIRSLSNPSSYQIKIEISDNQICYQPCKNNNVCVKGLCQCNLGYSGYDCSIQLINIDNAQNLTASQLYYFPYLEFSLSYDYLYQLSDQSQITYSCSSKHPHLLEYDYFLDQTYLNISLELMQNCQSFYEREILSYQKAFHSFIVLRLLQPDNVKLITQQGLPASTLGLLGIVFGCIGGFILIIVGICIRKCQNDAQKKKKHILEQQQEKELLNQCIPTFDYQSLITKYPGLKDDVECLICLIQFQPIDQVRLTYCTHIFHNLCIEAWLTKHKTCPMCRDPLEVKSIPNVFLESHAHNQRTKSIHGTEEILHMNKLSHRLLGNNQTHPNEESKQKISEEKSSQEKNRSAVSHPYK